MTSTYQVSSFARAIAWCFSTAVLLVGLGGCNPTAPEENALKAQSRPQMPFPPRTDGEFSSPSEATLRANRKPAPPRAAPPFGLTVKLSTQSLPSNLPEAAQLFVYLRAPEERMPIAVKHFPARSIPETVTFYSEGALELVEVVARLSLTGRVERSDTDIEASSVASMSHPLDELSLEPGEL